MEECGTAAGMPQYEDGLIDLLTLVFTAKDVIQEKACPMGELDQGEEKVEGYESTDTLGRQSVTGTFAFEQGNQGEFSKAPKVE
jgi:hypothetical protein